MQEYKISAQTMMTIHLSASAEISLLVGWRTFLFAVSTVTTEIAGAAQWQDSAQLEYRNTCCCVADNP